MPLRLKRIYDEPEPSDGHRVLVERLWPRGMTRERAALDEWLREVAPSAELRGWFGHRPERWREFQVRYRRELSELGPALEPLAARSRRSNVTLLFAARDVERNGAVVLARHLTERLEA